jgi:aryl-alcohol dehydrogenase-like predicted oxidoreductase
MRNVVIGGAQFGHEYGVLVNNAFSGKEYRVETLEACLDSGFKIIDLSLNYKGAVENLSESGLSQKFSYNTKFSYKQINHLEILEQLKKSLQTLGVANYQSILLHDWYALTPSERDQSVNFLSFLEKLGLTESIGISVYDEKELSPSLACLDVIQAPLNFFNITFLDSKIVSDLVLAGVKMQARSIFLQGLLLDNNEIIRNPFFKQLEEFNKYVKHKDTTHFEAALEVYDNQNIFTSLVVGFLRSVHVKQIYDLELRKSDVLDYLKLNGTKPEFADPRKWRKAN